jgi:hypothetical protein
MQAPSIGGAPAWPGAMARGPVDKATIEARLAL